MSAFGGKADIANQIGTDSHRQAATASVVGKWKSLSSAGSHICDAISRLHRKQLTTGSFRLNLVLIF